MNNSTLKAPLPMTTVVRRQQYYPRVPPELLFREHAGKFRLSGLTLAALLDAVSPRVNPILPPFVARTDTNGGASDEFMRTLVREAHRRPSVPRDNIKELNPVAQHERKMDKTGRGMNAMVTASSAMSPSSTMEKRAFGEDDDNHTAFVFEEVVTSRLTAVATLRKSPNDILKRSTSKEGEKGGGGDGFQKTQHSHYGKRQSGASMEDREALWGYSTGAVLLVTLRSYAADLRNRREYETLPLRLKNSYTQNKLGQTLNSVGRDSESLFSSTEENRKTINATSQSYSQDRDIFRNIGERAPHGVSLLGYHQSGGVYSLVYDSRNDLAISGGVDGTLLVWDVHQRYRGALREKYLRNEEARNVRPTQQFAEYIHTRRLTQRISHAHRGAISSLATHCELLLSGGVDCTVKIWSCQEYVTLSDHRAPPQYVEQQVFNCNGWVRHIWSAAGRNVQGDDVLITDESGGIIGFRGYTISEEPILQPTSRGKKLLNALRRAAGGISEVKLTPRRRRSSSMESNSSHQFPIITMGRMGSGNSRISTSSSSSAVSNEREALKRLHRGFITRILRVTRKLQTLGEEARLATSPINRSTVKDESTSAITRLIPLVERNLFIVVGYSPVIRFLDVTRLSVAGVIMHPNLSAETSERNNGNTQSSFSENSQGMGKGHPNGSNNNINTNTNTNYVQNDYNRTNGNTSNNVEVLRFVDVLYVNSHDYLLLLDNRNTIFVWDNVENKYIASWKSPERDERGKQNIAFRLLPCGTRHYESGDVLGSKRMSNQHRYRPKRRVACYYERTDPLEADLSMETDLSDVTAIPFYLVCSMGMELCTVVLESEARKEFQAHQDVIVGIFLRESIPSSLHESESEPDDYEDGDNTTDIWRKWGKCADIFANTLSNRMTWHPTRGRGSTDTLEDFKCIMSSKDFQKSLRETKDSDRTHVLSCSVDGDVRLWGTSFEPLIVYRHNNVIKKNSEFCTTVLHPLVDCDKSISPFDAPPRIVKRKDGVICRVENAGSHDITSFYFNSRWNLAVTGHDDGSICYWSCGTQLENCVWHKGIHRNTVSGLAAACLKENKNGLRSLARLGSIADALIPPEPTEFLVTISFDGCLALWEYPEQSRAEPHGRRRISFNELLCVAFEEISGLLIVGDSAGTISSWYVRGLEPYHSIPSRPPSPWKPSATISSFGFPTQAMDSGYLAVLERQRKTKISDTTSSTTANGAGSDVMGKKRAGHTEAVTAILVDGVLVFSGGEDGRVFLWDIRKGVLLREYFLLHDADEIAQHCRNRESSSGGSSLVDSRDSNPRFSETTNVAPQKIIRPEYTENVTCIALLKRRNGNFIVGTREGWIYQFEQKSSYPQSTYKHTSSVRCICVLQEGYAEKRNNNTLVAWDDYSNTLSSEMDQAFEIVVGDTEGKMSVIREPHFFSTVLI